MADEGFKCKACGGCCRFFLIPISDKWTEDQRRWLKFHKVQLQPFPGGGGYYARIPIKCDYLRDNKCVLHDGDKPEMCREYFCNMWGTEHPFGFDTFGQVFEAGQIDRVAEALQADLQIPKEQGIKIAEFLMEQGFLLGG